LAAGLGEGDGQERVMASLFQRLDEEEAIVRGELDALREKMAAGEERLARLTITRETARQLLGEDHEHSDPACGAESVSAAGGSRPPELVSPPGLAELEAKLAAPEPPLADRPVSSHPADPAPPALPGPGRVEWAVGMERIVAVLATSGRLMRTREIAAAIGEDASLATRVETTRSRLKRLVKQGKVVEKKPGYFRIAPAARVAGEAPGTG
jgi:hypothetical protein